MIPTLSHPRLLTAIAAFCLALAVSPTFAAFTQYDTETYDLAQGVPKFVDVVYIDLLKITRISLFRSNAGHDYSDTTQFGLEAINHGMSIESCRSMKHYFVAPDDTAKIYAPVSGVVSRIFDESIGGAQVQITSDAQNAFTFFIFHVLATPALKVGDHVIAGQLIGHHVGSQTYSDIAVAVHTPTGYHLISYFDTLTDAAFAAFQARGVTSREQLSYTRAQADAAPNRCTGANAAGPPLPADYFDLAPGAAGQTISTNTIPAALQINALRLRLGAISSAGLPVLVAPLTPKVCIGNAQEVNLSRPGICVLSLTQPGDATHIAAPPVKVTFTILPVGESFQLLPRIGGVFPPSAAVQSYLRFYNAGSGAGTVTLSLFDGDTGNTVTKWTSPSIAPGAAPQFGIDALEATAAPGFTRPSTYGLKIEPETTLASGAMQHVLYNPITGVLTNASSCSTGVVGNPITLIGVHTATLAAGNPSTLTYGNALHYSAYPEFELHNATTGTLAGLGAYTASHPNFRPVSANGALTVAATTIEAALNFTPSPDMYHYAVKALNFQFPTSYVQHLVASMSAGVIADMTAQCDLAGFTVNHAVPATLFTASIYSGSNTAAQSFLRVYNASTFAGPVTITLRDVVTGLSLGQWTSPEVPFGAEHQYAIGAIETAIGLVKKASYTLSVDAPFNGSFQHVLWRAPSGALSNLSTCAGSVMTDPKTLIAVHTSAIGAAGYPSTIIVNNTGAAAAVATLGIYNAADGSRLGTYTSAAIPSNAQLKLGVAALEVGANIAPRSASNGHYVVKLESGFTGFLQHYVNNESAGAITDITLVCAL